MAMVPAESDKREHYRTPVRIQLSFHKMEDHAKLKSLKELGNRSKSAHTLDTSLGGMYVVSEEKLKKGDLLSLKISLPNRSVPFAAFAEVAWAGPEGAGIRFLAVKEEDAEFLGAYLKNLPRPE